MLQDPSNVKSTHLLEKGMIDKDMINIIILIEITMNCNRCGFINTLVSQGVKLKINLNQST